MSCPRGHADCRCADVTVGDRDCINVGLFGQFVSLMNIPIRLQCAREMYHHVASSFDQSLLESMKMFLGDEPDGLSDTLDAIQALQAVRHFRKHPGAILRSDEGIWTNGVIDIAAGLSGVAKSVSDIPWMQALLGLADTFDLDTEFLFEEASSHPEILAAWPR
nr:hypothetical protein TetV2_00208 [Oceanusvirus sp.]